MRVLTVHHAFSMPPAEGQDEPRSYIKGQLVTDVAEQTAIRESDRAHFCTPTDVDETFFAAEPEEVAEVTKAPRKTRA